MQTKTLHRVIRARNQKRQLQRKTLAAELTDSAAEQPHTKKRRTSLHQKEGLNEQPNRFFDTPRLRDARRAGYGLKEPPTVPPYVPHVLSPPIPLPQPSRSSQKGEKKEFDFDSARTVRNDFSQHFVDTGRYPSNFLRDSPLEERFEEYPKLKELIRLKNGKIKERATTPQYIRTNLRTFDFTSLGSRFDVILIDPPLEEYYRRFPSMAARIKPGEDIMWTFDEIAKLPIPDLAANPSFIFIWVGCAEGLDKGRELLNKWGYRRAEDITWLKANRVRPDRSGLDDSSDAPTTDRGLVFRRSKEHCIMGIRGTVRRSTDTHFIHCNVDTDVIIAEDKPPGDTSKPEEIYHIIEHFCLGRRRLELFGTDSNIRPGWVTIGADISGTNFDPIVYGNFFSSDPDGYLVGSSSEIESLRPKSPPPPQAGKRGNTMSRGGRG